MTLNLNKNDASLLIKKITETTLILFALPERCIELPQLSATRRGLVRR